MTRQELAEALVDQMIENGRYGADSVVAEKRSELVWWAKKLPVAVIRDRLALEKRGIDSRKG